MPYELTFTKALPPLKESDYINACCIGGDLVVDRLLPIVQARYSDIQSNQEDWGWFIWMNAGEIKLAIDVHTDDEVAGTFRVHLTSSVKGRMWGERVQDTSELEDLRTVVQSRLHGWADSSIETRRVDQDYN
jgi:hypothetical protein